MREGGHDRPERVGVEPRVGLRREVGVVRGDRRRGHAPSGGEDPRRRVVGHRRGPPPVRDRRQEVLERAALGVEEVRRRRRGETERGREHPRRGERREALEGGLSRHPRRLLAVREDRAARDHLEHRRAQGIRVEEGRVDAVRLDRPLPALDRLGEDHGVEGQGGEVRGDVGRMLLRRLRVLGARCLKHRLDGRRLARGRRGSGLRDLAGGLIVVGSGGQPGRLDAVEADRGAGGLARHRRGRGNRPAWTRTRSLERLVQVEPGRRGRGHRGRAALLGLERGGRLLHDPGVVGRPPVDVLGDRRPVRPVGLPCPDAPLRVRELRVERIERSRRGGRGRPRRGGRGRWVRGIDSRAADVVDRPVGEDRRGAAFRPRLLRRRGCSGGTPGARRSRLASAGSACPRSRPSRRAR